MNFRPSMSTDLGSASAEKFSSLRSPDLALLIGTILVFFLLAFRVLFVENAVVFHDEYIYKAASDLLIDQKLLLARGDVPSIPNRLYLAIVAVHSYFNQNAYAVSGVLNVIFYVAAVLPLMAIGSLIGLTGWARTAAVLLGLVLPYSLYTKYFMPEAWYIAPFVMSQAALMHGLLHKSGRAVFLSGATLAVLYFIKPHASFLVVTSLLVIVLSGWKTAERIVRPAAVFLIGFGVSFLVVRGFLDLAFPVDQTLGLYGTMANGSWQTLRTMLADNPKGLIGQLGYVFWGHALYVGFLYGLPLAAAGLALRAVDTPASRPVTLLAIVALVTVIGLMLVSIVFTVSVQEVGRIHMRYYGFAFCLLPMFLFVPSAVPPGRWERRIFAAGVAAFALLAVIFFGKYNAVIRIATAGDAPDMAIVNLSWRAFLALAVLPLLGAGSMFFGHPAWRAAAVAFLLVFSGTDAVIVTRLIGTTFNNDFTRGEEATVVDKIVPPAERNDALIVGHGRDDVSKFLFGFRAAPQVLYRPKDGAVDDGDIPAGTRWLVALDGSLRFPAKAERILALPNLAVYRWLQ